MILLTLHSAVLVGYRLYEPESAEDSRRPEFLNTVIDYDSLREYTLSSGPSAIHYYFFCSVENNDCDYMETTVIKSAAKTTGIDLASLIEYVDITEIEQQLRTNQLKNDWNIASYPAFATTRNTDGRITIMNRLEWNPQAPVNEANLVQWLIQNGLYDAGSSEPIETPAS